MYPSKAREFANSPSDGVSLVLSKPGTWLCSNAAVIRCSSWVIVYTNNSCTVPGVKVVEVCLRAGRFTARSFRQLPGKRQEYVTSGR